MALPAFWRRFGGALLQDRACFSVSGSASWAHRPGEHGRLLRWEPVTQLLGLTARSDCRPVLQTTMKVLTEQANVPLIYHVAARGYIYVSAPNTRCTMRAFLVKARTPSDTPAASPLGSAKLATSSERKSSATSKCAAIFVCSCIEACGGFSTTERFGYLQSSTHRGL
jgi:hypothetical protein